jgi:Dyp-type peroxidase family
VNPDLRRLQGLLTSAYPRSPAARYVLVELPDPPRARAWLGTLTDRVTFADTVDEQIRGLRGADRPNLNVAFTAAGLAALGVTADRMTDFSREFREGMVTPHRQRVLGDLAGTPSDPLTWRWGGPGNSTVHGVLLIFGSDEAEINGLIEEALDPATGVRLVRAVTTVALAGTREHFGFRDAIASPWVAGLHRPRSATDRLAAGEIILGHADLTGRPEPYPLIGRDGSYLVIRQLAQDVPGFWSALRGAVGDVEAVRWAAKMTGRWPDGTPLAREPDGPIADPSDDFGYHDDPDGVRCPLGAHIRRTNPRDGLGAKPADSVGLVNRHRIFRRGRTFGLPAPPETWPAGIDPVVAEAGPPDADGERGVVFIGLGASLARQFEFVQQSWINNPKFAGLYDENDPITGSAHRQMTESSAGFDFTAPGPVLNDRIELPAKYVRCMGGGYFFLPGRDALQSISGRPGS